MIAAILINGLLSGAGYALLAVAFSLVFGVAKILNMAHTAFYMIAAYMIFMATSMFGIPLLPSVIMAIIIAGILGIICFRLFLDRVREHETSVMIISLAIVMFLQEILLIGFGARLVTIPPFVPGSIEIFGTPVSYQYFFAIGTCLFMLLGLWVLLQKTMLGGAIRAVAEDREIANLMGINVSRVCTITMGISTALAGLSGAVVAPIFMVDPYMWMQPLIIVLAAVILGGLGSTKGSVIGALILGFSETAVVFLVPKGSFLRGAVSLSVMVAVLLFRAQGLFGVVFEEEML